MSWTRWLARFRRPCPEVPVTPALREAIEALLGPVDPLGDPQVSARALRGALVQVVLPPAVAYVAAVDPPAAELEAELALLAVVGFTWALGGRAGEVPASAAAGALVSASAEYVGYDYRPRFTEGPAPLINAMTRVGLDGEEPWSVAAGITGQRLRLGRRPGGSEGWFRLGLLAWVAGEELAQPPDAQGSSCGSGSSRA